MIKQFSTEEEMIQYEADRDQFYLNELQELKAHWWNCYLQWLKYIFLSSIRRKKKEYDGYKGGYWIDSAKHVCAHSLAVIQDLDTCADVKPGTIAIHQSEIAIYNIYVYDDWCWKKLSLANYGAK